MNISVIIPIRDGLDTLGRCLASLKRSSFPDFEVIVVDDCSRQDCSGVVRSFGFKSIRLNQPRGVEYARNQGAQLATGDILVFTDCDMIVPQDALHRIHDRFSGNHYAAVSGICGLKTPTSQLVTLYKNLWMYYSYTVSPEHIDWFITGIGAVRREVFLGLRGFDTSFNNRAGGGDLDFGRRLREAGENILLDKSLQVEHLHRYSLRGLLRNDFNRSKGWFQLALRKKMIPQVVRKLSIANIYPTFIVSVLLSFISFFSLLLLPFFRIFLPVAILSIAAYLIINYPLFRFFRWEGGAGFLLKAIPLSWIDHLAAGFGIISGGLSYLGLLVIKRLFKFKSPVSSLKKPVSG